MTRGSPRDNLTHIILAVVEYDIKEFISQSNLPYDEKNMWGVLKHIIKLFKSKESGKYVLLRDNEKVKKK